MDAYAYSDAHIHACTLVYISVHLSAHRSMRMPIRTPVGDGIIIIYWGWDYGFWPDYHAVRPDIRNTMTGTEVLDVQKMWLQSQPQSETGSL